MEKLSRPQAPAMFRALFPGLADWLESPWAGPPQFTAARSFRVEEVARDDRYVIRAELPGLDPEKDIEVTAEGRTLTIHAQRRQADSDLIARSSVTAPSPGWSGCPPGWTPRTSPPATTGESSRSVSRCARQSRKASGSRLRKQTEPGQKPWGRQEPAGHGRSRPYLRLPGRTGWRSRCAARAAASNLRPDQAG